MIAAAGQGPVPALARGSRRPGRASRVRSDVRSALREGATPVQGEAVLMKRYSKDAGSFF